MTDSNDDLAQQAVTDAAKFRRWAWCFRANFVALVPFWFVSTEAAAQRAILIYLAAVSIHALVVTYDGKAEAAEAKAASYENP